LTFSYPVISAYGLSGKANCLMLMHKTGSVYRRRKRA
jgi:hypothetical protein